MNFVITIISDVISVVKVTSQNKRKIE